MYMYLPLIGTEPQCCDSYLRGSSSSCVVSPHALFDDQPGHIVKPGGGHWNSESSQSKLTHVRDPTSVPGTERHGPVVATQPVSVPVQTSE